MIEILVETDNTMVVCASGYMSPEDVERAVNRGEPDLRRDWIQASKVPESCDFHTNHRHWTLIR